MSAGYILLPVAAIALASKTQDDGTSDIKVPASTTPPVGSRPIPVGDLAQKPPAINIGAVARRVGAVTGNWTKSDQVKVDQAMQMAEQEVRKEYEALAKSSKKAGAEYLNSTMNPSPNLTGNEDFKEASKKIGAAAGAIGGAAVCSVTGAGVAAAPVCAYLGNIAGAYLGKEIGPYVKKYYNKLEGLAEDIGGAIKDTGKTVYNNTLGRLF